jgi:hypothetical protein
MTRNDNYAFEVVKQCLDPELVKEYVSKNRSAFIAYMTSGQSYTPLIMIFIALFILAMFAICAGGAYKAY